MELTVKRWRTIVLVALVVIAGVAWYGWHRWHEARYACRLPNLGSVAAGMPLAQVEKVLAIQGLKLSRNGADIWHDLQLPDSDNPSPATDLHLVVQRMEPDDVGSHGCEYVLTFDQRGVLKRISMIPVATLP